MSIKVFKTREEWIMPIPFEVGETNLDLKEVADTIKRELDNEFGENQYKILGYYTKIIRPKEVEPDGAGETKNE